ncbi:MAG: hypothetical protein KTR24_04475, partial [Saprospiraceae bacterium]|nr:hypothetical protein [Saprospiraceae bacterium]
MILINHAAKRGFFYLRKADQSLLWRGLTQIEKDNPPGFIKIIENTPSPGSVCQSRLSLNDFDKPRCQAWFFLFEEGRPTLALERPDANKK